MLASAFVSLLPGVLVVASGSEPAQKVELRARVWFNSPSIRVPDDRTYVLYFFSTVGDRDLAEVVPRLNKLHRRRDVVVVGLTPEWPDRAAAFVKGRKVGFAVGAGSRAYRDFGIKEFPKLVVLWPQRGGREFSRESLELKALEERLEPLPEPDAFTSGAFDENSPAEMLRRHVAEETDRSQRLRALSMLRRVLPAEDFLDFCDLLVRGDQDPFWHGKVLYQRQLADPQVVEKEPRLSPYSMASRACHENPDDPRWDPVREYMAGIEERTVQQLYQDYWDHLGDDPVDLNIRITIPHTMADLPDKAAARECLMQMFLAEPDFVIRQRIVGALSDACQPGDFEAADFLEEQLQIEENIRAVRPMLEYVIRYLRTGEE